jgi:phenylpropionate dioxygenase-like ring-hydroxylating dioxygenase large terminal subunit
VKLDLTALTEAEAAGIQIFEKPAVGSWTKAFGLETGPVSFRDCYDPEFYELEKEAVFRRSWLQVGRVEELPRQGTYFTKELEFLGVSLLVLRGMDDQIRAFHNVCSHRGNKLMWDDFPAKESKGSCRAISCKYHGWRYDLEGEISYVHNAPEFFDLAAEDLALPKVHLDTWAGFIFVNLDEEPRESLQSFLGPGFAQLERYPFHEMTYTFSFTSVVQGNWKLFKDAFQESYHFPHVHARATNPEAVRSGADRVPSMVPYFAKLGKHGIYTSAGPKGNMAIRARQPLPANTLFRADVFGYEDAIDIELGNTVNPGGVPTWGFDSWQIYPNFTILTRGRSNYFTFSYWPIGPNAMRMVHTISYLPPRSPREWAAVEHATNINRELGSEDVSAPEATQTVLASGGRAAFYLADQEVLIRHFHAMVQADVEALRRELAEKPGR